MVKICEDCGEPIKGKHIEALGKYYHPDHFKCAICGEVIDDKFVEVEGEPCHEECYKEGFAPRCGWCGEIIEGEAVKDEEKSYHVDCYKENLGIDCDICGETMAGNYLTDFWGNNFCEKHVDEYPQCPYCSTLIAPGLDKEKVSYEDGRIVCKSCDRKSVKNHSHAKKLTEEVIEVLSDYGIDIDLNGVEIDFVSKPELEKLAKKGSRGFTKIRKNEKNPNRSEIKITILKKLPSFEFKRVIAHELMHVWLNRTSSGEISEDKKEFIEGSCEYASYLVIKTENTEYGKLQAELLPLNREKTYKYGFEEVKNFVKDNSIEIWLDKLKSI